MSDSVKVVPSDTIEDIVGSLRFNHRHVARAVSKEKTIYILHSKNCRDTNADLRQCKYSKAIENGIDEKLWADHMDKPMIVTVENDVLTPTKQVDRVSLTQSEKNRTRGTS